MLKFKCHIVDLKRLFGLIAHSFIKIFKRVHCERLSLLERTSKNSSSDRLQK